MEELKERIREYVAAHPRGKRKAKNMAEALGVTQEELQVCLDEMVEDYELFLTKEKQYKNRAQEGIYEGTLSVAKSGLGFLDVEGRDAIRIDEFDQLDALNGDKVLVRCQTYQTYGEVIRVLSRAHSTVVGTYTTKAYKLYLELDDSKLANKQLKVILPDEIHPTEGMKVLCTIEKYGTPLVVRVEKSLGHKDDPGVDILAVLLEHGIEPDFPEEVKQEVIETPTEVTENDLDGRRDLRDFTTVTIDGDDSKDFDDAVCVVPEQNGYRLLVSIADVSHYVRANSALDKEAQKRSFSTYVVDRVVPMLPHELSNGICSLNPKVMRLTLTCDMQVSKNGEITSYEIYPSVIRSDERMTYNNVNKILKGDEQLQNQYEHLGTLFTDLADCADAIRKHRVAKGAIEFQSKESDITVDENGHPIDVQPKHSGHAEEMIEDCMIAANVCVANYMNKNKIPAVYRVHGQPQAKKIKEFMRVSAYLGHRVKFKESAHIKPKEIQEYLNSIQDSDEYPVLSMLMLRCMQKAKYLEKCEGHFGIAEEEYLHFTSPIRRYPDLMVHRMLHDYVFEPVRTSANRYDDDLHNREIAEHASERERACQDAEYACDDMKKAEYMLDHLGETYQGIISSVQSYGLYVELPNTIEGMVRVADLPDDYYSFDEERMQFVGTHTNRIYRVGMKVDVIVMGASKELGTVDFGLAQKQSSKQKNKDKNTKKNGRRKK